MAMPERKKPTVAELQALLPVSLEDRLLGLTALIGSLAEQAGSAAATGMGYQDSGVKYRLKWLNIGKMEAFREVVLMLEALLDQTPKPEE